MRSRRPGRRPRTRPVDDDLGHTGSRQQHRRLEKALTDDCCNYDSAGRTETPPWRSPFAPPDRPARNLLRENAILASRAAVEAAPPLRRKMSSAPPRRQAAGRSADRPPGPMVAPSGSVPARPITLGRRRPDKPARAELTFLDEKAVEKPPRPPVLADLARQGEEVRRLLSATSEDANDGSTSRTAC